jgi:hypothetical protein
MNNADKYLPLCYSLNILKNIDNNISATKLQKCAECISLVRKILTTSSSALPQQFCAGRLQRRGF